MKKLMMVCLGVMLLLNHAYGFNNERRGFVLGLGGAYHGTTLSPTGGSDVSQNGFVSSVKIGGGINEHVLLYYVREAAWFNQKNSTLGSDIYVSGISGLGVSYYLQDEENESTMFPFYSTGALGLADYGKLGSFSSVDYGAGFLLGVGYEIKKHFSVEGKLMSTRIDADYSNVDIDITSYMLTFNYLWY